MTTYTLTIEVEAPFVDPTRVDPHEAAEAIVDEYNDACRANGDHELLVEFVGAEWVEVED